MYIYTYIPKGRGRGRARPSLSTELLRVRFLRPDSRTPQSDMQTIHHLHKACQKNRCLTVSSFRQPFLSRHKTRLLVFAPRSPKNKAVPKP